MGIDLGGRKCFFNKHLNTFYVIGHMVTDTEIVRGEPTAATSSPLSD